MRVRVREETEMRTYDGLEQRCRRCAAVLHLGHARPVSCDACIHTRA
jgi:hypothetical protein